MHARAAVSPLSGKPMREWLQVPCDWRRPEAKTQEGYALWWSDEDRYGQLLPRPSVEEIPSFYAGCSYYTHGDAFNEAPKRVIETNTFQRLLMALAWRADRGVEPTPEWWRRVVHQGAVSFLEIGCGSGGNMTTVSKFVGKVVGVEPDPAAREVAIGKGLEVFSGTAEDLPEGVQGQGWDVVAMIHVLEHCLDPIAALENARAALSTDGRLIVETPNNDCLGLAFKGTAWHWLDVPRHLNFFTTSSLWTACEKAGLRPIKAEYRGYCRQYSAGWIEAEAQIERVMSEGTSAARRTAYHTLTQAVQLLTTLGASPGRRYDSVRVICTR